MLFYWSRSIRADKKMFPSLLSKKVNCFCFSVVAQFPEDNVLYRGRLEALGDKGVDTGHRLLKVRRCSVLRGGGTLGKGVDTDHRLLKTLKVKKGSVY